MQTVITINAVIMALFFVCYSYQFFYVAVALLKRKKFTCRNENHRIAVLIAARNEENVIGQLLDSIHAQKNYPMDHVDIYVGADNCTDDTARVARERGAIVFERHDTVHVGKGYVLNEMLKRIKRPGRKHYDAYLVLDADNILDPNFISEIEKVYSSGFEIVTCYRNSKNFGSSWISAANATWYLREARFLNNARNICKTSCAVSGSGYLISASVIEGMHGWQFHTLTEDIQFTTFCAIHGIRIGYAPAEFFDEQPVTFKASWKQRMRWTKGFYQVFFTYGKHLVKSTFRYHRFAAYDMFMTIAPGMLLSLISMLANATFLIVGGLSHGFLATEVEMQACAASLIMTFAMMYQTFFILALLTTIFEYKHIHCAQKWRLVTNLFTFPIFMFSYIPITVAALFLKVDWVPTQHAVSVTLDEVMQGAK